MVLLSLAMGWVGQVTKQPEVVYPQSTGECCVILYKDIFHLVVHCKTQTCDLIHCLEIRYHLKLFIFARLCDARFFPWSHQTAWILLIPDVLYFDLYMHFFDLIVSMFADAAIGFLIKEQVFSTLCGPTETTFSVAGNSSGCISYGIKTYLQVFLAIRFSWLPSLAAVVHSSKFAVIAKCAVTAISI